jgi:hypothetical protein
MLTPERHVSLARRHLRAANHHQQAACQNPDDYRADLAARTHARDAYRHARLAEVSAPLLPGVIVRPPGVYG